LTDILAIKYIERQIVGQSPGATEMSTISMFSDGIDAVLERSERVLKGENVPQRDERFKTYAITNFRGGIGKSTLAFNLAYELSRSYRTLLIDACSQRNFSQNIFGDVLHEYQQTLYDALVVEITGAGTFDIEDSTVNVKGACLPFAGNKPTHMIPGSTELFVFPSFLYSQLAQFAQIAGGTHTKDASKKILSSLAQIIHRASGISKPEKVLLDTSPFFGGATHLAWVAADALIIPVRVDQHSISALRLTLKMLTDPNMDFQKFNAQAGLSHTPKVHAIVMTHCGWNRQRPNAPDSSTRFFVEQALGVAQEFAHVFSDDDVSRCFYLLDDFHSSGRISGNQRIPLAKLHKGTKYVVEGQRLEVNPSVDRYKREVANLTAAL
jgi:chromosome partitioning protein